MNKLVLLAGIAALLGTPAFAGDLPPAAAPAPNYPALTDFPDVTVDQWSGFYAGIFAGYANGTATAIATATDTIDLTGGIAGGTVGANFQMNSFVLGLEGDVAWAGLNGSVVCAADDDFDCAGEIDWLSTVRARAGISLDRVLVYATAGLAVAGGKATVTPTPTPGSGEFSDTFLGWTAGVGAEMKLTDSMSVKLEYAYTDLGKKTAETGTLSNLGDTEVSAKLQSVKLGLNFAF